jgi:hypothetical protein
MYYKSNDVSLTVSVCLGIDLKDMAGMGATLAAYEDVARRCKVLEEMIHNYQDYISALERVKY